MFIIGNQTVIMYKKYLLFILCISFLAACGQNTPTALVTEQSIPTIALPTREPSETPAPVDESEIIPLSAVSPLELAVDYQLPGTYLAERLAAPAVADGRVDADEQRLVRSVRHL